jgi:hypothetical protein
MIYSSENFPTYTPEDIQSPWPEDDEEPEEEPDSDSDFPDLVGASDSESEAEEDWPEKKTTPPSAKRQGSKILRE